MQKAKWLSEEALQIAVKRREAKGKGKKERYAHLNADFQRIARRDKKAFLSGQCKEIEENNRMGKTRDLLKKIRDTKGTFQSKMDTTKGRNGINLTEGAIKKAECQRTDAFELWCWRRLLRDPRTARRSNQSILKEISPEYSLEGLMLMLKLQYFGHLMQRIDSLEKTLML